MTTSRTIGPPEISILLPLPADIERGKAHHNNSGGLRSSVSQQSLPARVVVTVNMAGTDNPPHTQGKLCTGKATLVQHWRDPVQVLLN